MGTAPWALALKLQILISITAFLLAWLVLRVPWRTALLACLVCNTVPVMQPPGFATWLYMVDLTMPVLLLIMLVSLGRLGGRTFTVGLVALFLFPAISTLFGAYVNIGTRYAWVAFLYRRLVLVQFLAIGACGLLRRVDLRDFMDTWVIIWIGVAMVGLAQYLHLLNVDFTLSETSDLADVSVYEVSQRGFMGLNRAGVGLVGGLIATYSIGLLLLNQNIGWRRTILYTAAGSLSYVVVMFSGSRTGFLAAALGAALVLLKAATRARHVRWARAAIFLFLGLAMVVRIVLGGSGGTTVKERLDYKAGLQSDSFQSRLQAQKTVLGFVMGDIRAILLGMGGGAGEEWHYRVGYLTHAHNDYIQTLWETGVPGMVLYLWFLIVLFRRMKPPYTDNETCIGTVARAMMAVGLVMSLTEWFLVGSSGLDMPISAPILLFFGMVVHRMQETRSEQQWSLENPPGEWESEQAPAWEGGAPVGPYA